MKMQHDVIKIITRDPTLHDFYSQCLERSGWILNCNWDKYGAKKWINFSSVNADSFKCQIECFAVDCHKKQYIPKHLHPCDDLERKRKYTSRKLYLCTVQSGTIPLKKMSEKRLEIFSPGLC